MTVHFIVWYASTEGEYFFWSVQVFWETFLRLIEGFLNYILRPISLFPESKDQDKFSTFTMVAILVIVVTGFFVFFTLMAVCYRCVQVKLWEERWTVVNVLLNVIALSFKTDGERVFNGNKIDWRGSEVFKCHLSVQCVFLSNHQSEQFFDFTGKEGYIAVLFVRIFIDLSLRLPQPPNMFPTKGKRDKKLLTTRLRFLLDAQSCYHCHTKVSSKSMISKSKYDSKNASRLQHFRY